MLRCPLVTAKPPFSAQKVRGLVCGHSFTLFWTKCAQFCSYLWLPEFESFLWQKIRLVKFMYNGWCVRLQLLLWGYLARQYLAIIGIFWSFLPFFLMVCVSRIRPESLLMVKIWSFRPRQNLAKWDLWDGHSEIFLRENSPLRSFKPVDLCEIHWWFGHQICGNLEEMATGLRWIIGGIWRGQLQLISRFAKTSQNRFSLRSIVDGRMWFSVLPVSAIILWYNTNQANWNKFEGPFSNTARCW